MRLGKRDFSLVPVIAGGSVLLLALSLLLLFRSEKQVKIYDKEFQVVDVEYNHATVMSGKRLKERLIRVLARLGTPQKFLNKLREPQRSQLYSARAFSFAPTPEPDTVRVYFKWPYSFDDLTNFYGELINERGKKILLRGGGRGSNPNRNEKYKAWDVPPGKTDSNSVYTLRIIRSIETNVVRVADIRLGHLKN